MYKMDDNSLMHVNFVYGGCAMPFLGQQPVVNIIEQFLMKKKQMKRKLPFHSNITLSLSAKIRLYAEGK